jgi:hypothetical protein
MPHSAPASASDAASRHVALRALEALCRRAASARDVLSQVSPDLDAACEAAGLREGNHARAVAADVVPSPPPNPSYPAAFAAPTASFAATLPAPFPAAGLPPPFLRVAGAQAQLERLIEKNYYLHKSARDAYRSYLHAYAAHSLKNIFDVYNLDLQATGKAFGFAVPPKVTLNLKPNPKASKKRGALGGDNPATKRQNSGHVFSSANPYGQRPKGDKRQFMHG